MTREQFICEIQVLQEPLRRFLLVLCEGDAFTADDIAQDACIKAWMGIESFKGASKFSTWLFKIAYNSWCDRKYASKASGLDDSAGQQFIDNATAEDSFRYQALYQAIASLKPSEKVAILLFYMEEKSIKEIAAILGKPQGTVKSLLSRGRNNLKIRLK